MQENVRNNQAISIDVSIYSIINNRLHILLIQRAKEPYKNMWSLIGGIVLNSETCEESVKRELEEKVGITNISPKLSGVFSDPKRDSRYRNISISYCCMANSNLSINCNPEKVLDVKWFPVAELPELAFDHDKIIEKSYADIKESVYDIEYMKPYLPETFTFSTLQMIYESILGVELDKRNFRRKINSLKCLIDTGKKNEQDTHKKSNIYKLK